MKKCNLTGLVQTTVALAESYYSCQPNVDKIYELTKDEVSGFPGIWWALGDFALDVETKFARLWNRGDREFIDDVEVIIDALFVWILSEGRWPNITDTTAILDDIIASK